MRILVVKLTSMGDAIHVLPALSDLAQHHPDAKVDWMIEQSFAEIPAWHPLVDRIIPVATRRWRKAKWQNAKEFGAFWKLLRQQQYDLIIDAQGLMKSAVFSRFARLSKGGVRAGFSADSIKERPAAKLYVKKIDVARDIHAVERLRLLFSQAFGYSYDANTLNYSVPASQPQNSGKQVMFLHGTTWPSKHLPETQWQQLVQLATADGYQVLLPWGNEHEQARAQRLAENNPQVEVLPRCSLNELRQKLSEVSTVRLFPEPRLHLPCTRLLARGIVPSSLSSFA